MQSADNFTAKLTMIRQRLNHIRHRQAEHFKQFKRLNIWNINFKAIINVLNTISVTSLVLTFSGSQTTLVICTISNSISAIGTAVLSVVNMEAKSHSHQTSYLQFVELHDTYIAELLHDNLNGQDLDRILTDLNSKVGLILDNCEPIDLSADTPPPTILFNKSNQERTTPHQSMFHSVYRSPDTDRQTSGTHHQQNSLENPSFMGINSLKSSRSTNVVPIEHHMPNLDIGQSLPSSVHLSARKVLDQSHILSIGGC
jgi:hypothetical protein